MGNGVTAGRSFSRRAMLASGSIWASRVGAQGSLPVIRIGVLWDRSGVGAATSGLDQIVSARLAVADFGHLSRGYPVELVDAEFERRPDQAVTIARKWFDESNLAAIVDLPGTAAPAQVQELARVRGRTVMNTSSVNAALTGAACAPTATHWMDDTVALTRAMTIGMSAGGVNTWFLVVPDDTLGLAFQADATVAIESSGGRVVGFVRYPSDSTSFARPLASARDSVAAAIGLCAMGPPLVAQVRQAREMGLFDASKAICAYAATIRDVHALGAPEAQGLWLTTGFYWNRNEQTRSFSFRFNEITSRMPDKSYAVTYTAIGHFLRIVKALDTVDAAVANAAMRREPVYFFGDNGRVRIDGRVMLDMGLYRVKAQEAVREPWDYYEPIRTISAADVFRPRAKGGCALAP